MFVCKTRLIYPKAPITPTFQHTSEDYIFTVLAVGVGAAMLDQ